MTISISGGRVFGCIGVMCVMSLGFSTKEEPVVRSNNGIYIARSVHVQQLSCW